VVVAPNVVKETSIREHFGIFECLAISGIVEGFVPLHWEAFIFDDIQGI
jgi:hypothetical protein